MLEALPQWVTFVIAGVVILALPFLLAWMVWDLFLTTKGVAQGFGGGPSKACVALGLTVRERGPLSGSADGLFESHAVRISWVVGHAHGYDPKYHLTRVVAQVSPPLALGLELEEGAAAKAGIGWPELEQHMAASATDAAGARAALAPAGQALWGALGGPGRVCVDDGAVTIVLPGVGAERAELEAALRRAVVVARALSAR